MSPLFIAGCMNKAAADRGGGAALQSDTEQPLMYKW